MRSSDGHEGQAVATAPCDQCRWYVDTRLEDLRREMKAETKRLDERWTREEHAKTIASETLERRLQGMNEIKELNAQQAATFVPRIEMDLKFSDFIRRLDVMERLGSNWTGRSWGLGKLGYVVLAIGAFLGTLLIYHIQQSH